MKNRAIACPTLETIVDFVLQRPVGDEVTIHLQNCVHCRMQANALTEAIRSLRDDSCGSKPEGTD